MSYIPRPDIVWQKLKELDGLVRRLLTQSPLGFSSITRGSLRVASNEGLIVEGSAKVSGWLIVTGTERVVGRLEGSGTFDWTGPMNLRGSQSVTGPTEFTGSVDITGPLDVLGTWKLTGNGDIIGDVDITGILRLLSDLLVKAGGRIVVEGGSRIVLEQSGGVARMGMGASEIRGGDGLGLYPNNGPSIISTSAGLRLANLPTISAASSGLMPDSLHIDALGFVRRVV